MKKKPKESLGGRCPNKWVVANWNGWQWIEIVAVSRYTWWSVENGGRLVQISGRKPKRVGSWWIYNLNHAFYVSLEKGKEKKKLKIHLNPSALVHVCKSADWEPWVYEDARVHSQYGIP